MRKSGKGAASSAQREGLEKSVMKLDFKLGLTFCRVRQKKRNLGCKTHSEFTQPKVRFFAPPARFISGALIRRRRK